MTTLRHHHPPCPADLRGLGLRRVLGLAFALVLIGGPAETARADDPPSTGAGNARARELAHRSVLVQSAMRYLTQQARRIQAHDLRAATLDILQNPTTCVWHRRGLASVALQDAVIQSLLDQGLINPDDASGVAGGVRAAIFPPLLQADTPCPQLPQPFESAPGSSFGGHHSYPGGLPVHEANNDGADENLWRQYQTVYGHAGASGQPQVGARGAADALLPIDLDVILAAPIWHDWAKTLVFQWNADGSEFAEFNFGGAGSNDAWGRPGDSRTGAHHILSIAEAMARGLPPLMVITQASAHAAPTGGNEYKVVNWLRAAALIARVDPVQAGYLRVDSSGQRRLAPIDAAPAGDPDAVTPANLRVEYSLHNLSDADYLFSGPAVASDEVLLAWLAPAFGYDPKEAATYNNRYRNPVLSQLSAERVQIECATRGVGWLRAQLQRLRRAGVI